MDPKYIIVQAGGRGSRLGKLTANKPKALVPINNAPIVFHLFNKFPDKEFIVISDYKSDVLKRYLDTFAAVPNLVVDCQGESGTCAGISKALRKLPPNEPFMLIWSDLVLSPNFEFPRKKGNYIGLSDLIECRWCYKGGKLEEVKSRHQGVVGLFVFEDKRRLESVPDSGEFVKWLSEKPGSLIPFDVGEIKEYGVMNAFEINADEDASRYQCRPFNSIVENDDGTTITKTALDEQGRDLADKEKSWYKRVECTKFKQTPRIYSYNPLVMERIPGKNVFEYDLNRDSKQNVLKRIMQGLYELHNTSTIPTDWFSIKEAYLGKTWRRLEKVRNLIPFADKKTITINGETCKNIYFYKQKVEKIFDSYQCEEFKFIHGDTTFSNIILDSNYYPYFIDPRGYFGYIEYYGDPCYDWAKLYYSIVGNYDQFNLKKFNLSFEKNEISLTICSNGWEDMENLFFELLPAGVEPKYIRLIHAIIWLSLTTYAWEDYDSICGAFYNGLRYLNDCLTEFDE